MKKCENDKDWQNELTLIQKEAKREEKAAEKKPNVVKRVIQKVRDIKASLFEPVFNGSLIREKL